MGIGCNPLKCTWGCCYIPQRVVMAIFLHLALQTAYNLRQVLNIAIVTMVKREESNLTRDPCPMHKSEEIKNIKGGTYDWPPEVEMLLLYSFYIGYFISHVPGGWLADTYGGRHVCGCSLLASTVITFIFPETVIRIGYPAAVVLRTVLGLAQGPILPAISAMMSEWIPASERSSLGAIAYSGGPLGTVIGNLVSGILIGKWNSWVIAFYFWSAWSIVWYLLYLLYVFSHPDRHPFLLAEERLFLKEYSVEKIKHKIPWKKILTNVPFWANSIGHIGHNYIFYIMVTCLPKFMHEVLHFNIEANAAVSSMPFFFMWLACLFWGQVAHFIYRREMVSELASRKFFGVCSNVCSAICCLIAVYVGCHRVLVVILYVLALIFNAMYYCSLSINVNDLSQHFGGTMFAISNALGALAGVVGNALVGVFTKLDRSINGWRMVFWVQFAVSILSSVMFLFCAETERQGFDLEAGSSVMRR